MPFFISFYDYILSNEPVKCSDSKTLDHIKTTPSKQIQKPPMYKIIMLNDDFTPMDFVVHILETIFQKDNEEAVRIMFEVHTTGMGNCGVFTYEVAETKQAQTIQLAQKHQYPLRCVLEKE